MSCVKDFVSVSHFGWSGVGMGEEIKARKGYK
jgi:hypothetical protein